MTTQQWDEIADCFRHDDGSLPGIEITKLSAQGLSAIYAMLRGRSRVTGTIPPEFWSRTQRSLIPIDSVPDAAALVASGQAEAFHFCIDGIKAAGVALPSLGVFVWSDCIELDYRMGSQWGLAQVSGLFELLQECCALDPGAVVEPAASEGPPEPARFAKAWSTFRNSWSR